MSYEPVRQAAATSTIGREIDAGLQAHMRNVYNIMCTGLAVTGATAYAAANFEPLAKLVLTPPLYYVFAFAPLIFLMFGLTPNRMLRMTTGRALNMFVGFCVLMGLSMAAIFAVYSGASIARVFFISASMFAGMSIYGYTTKKDLSGMGNFLLMGAMGIFIAMIVNMFLASTMLHFVVSAIGVVVFTGLAAWETQVIKETYAVAHGRETNQKLAIIGALSLYMSFINLFHFMMSLMGQRE